MIKKSICMKARGVVIDHVIIAIRVTHDAVTRL